MSKLIIITGATRGLGLVMAMHSISQGYQVIAIGRTLSDGVRELMRGNPEMIYFEPYDFSKLDGIHDFTTVLLKRYGRPWGLVNNAAVGFDGILATQHEYDISKLIRINIEAPILLTKYVMRSMLIGRAGRVVNVSSIIASTGFNGLSVYGATKAALIGFTRSLAREVGKAGITVNVVAPGYMDTDMTSALGVDKLASIRRRSPLGDLAKPIDVAYAVSYLLSDGAANVTGTTLTVDAGSTA